MFETHRSHFPAYVKITGKNCPQSVMSKVFLIDLQVPAFAHAWLAMWCTSFSFVAPLASVP